MCFNTTLPHASVTLPWTPASNPLHLVYLEDHKVYWMDHSWGSFAITSVGLHTTEEENRQDRLWHRKFKREFNSYSPDAARKLMNQISQEQLVTIIYCLSPQKCSSLQSATAPCTPLVSHHSPKSFQDSHGDSATSAWLFSDLPPTYVCRRLSLGNTTSSQW